MATLPAGAAQYLTEAHGVGIDDANLDLEEEQESIKNSAAFDAGLNSQTERLHLGPPSKRNKTDNKTLYSNAKDAAANVVVSQTLKDYKR